MQAYDIIFILTIPMYSLSIFLMLNTFFDHNTYNIKIEVFSYSIYSVCLTLIFVFFRIPIVFLIFNILSFFILSLNYSAKLLNRILCTFFIYSAFMVIELVISGLIGFFDIEALKNSAFDSIIGIILIRIVTVIIAYCIYRFKKRLKKDFPIPAYYYFIHALIILGTLYLFIVSLENENLSLAQILLSSIAVILVNGLIILSDEKIYHAMLVYSERNTLKMQNIAYENQTEIINQSLLAIKSLRHDMKNHILCLCNMYENKKKDEINEYTAKILEQIDGNKQLVHSNNFVVNSILNFKLQELINIETEIKIDVNIPSNLNILAYDLTVILGNLLDNSISALKEMPNQANRKFTFSMRGSKGNLIILVDNSFNGNLNVENGKLKTTKAFKVNHGMGINNIEQVVSNYGGHIQIEHVHNVFRKTWAQISFLI